MVDNDWLLSMVPFLLSFESTRLGEKAFLGEALNSRDPCLETLALVGEMLLLSEIYSIERVLEHRIRETYSHRIVD